MKKHIWIVAVVIILVGAGIMLAAQGRPDKVSQVPDVFRDQGIGWITKDGITLLQTRQGASVYPVIHDQQALYILSGNADRIKKYRIDRKRQEIVVEQEQGNPRDRGEACFQVVKVPAAKYGGIVRDGTVTVRMQFNYLDNQSIHILYDLAAKTSKLVDGGQADR